MNKEAITFILNPYANVPRTFSPQASSVSQTCHSQISGKSTDLHLKLLEMQPLMKMALFTVHQPTNTCIFRID